MNVSTDVVLKYIPGMAFFGFLEMVVCFLRRKQTSKLIVIAQTDKTSTDPGEKGLLAKNCTAVAASAMKSIAMNTISVSNYYFLKRIPDIQVNEAQ
jgi:hypothetical protein